MLKLLIRCFIPRDEEIAKMIANAFAESINSKSTVTDTLVKYYPYADKLTEVQKTIVKWMEDGKVDDNEKAEIANALTPIITKIREEVGI